MYGCLAYTGTEDRLVKVIIVYKKLLQISIVNDWNIIILDHLGWVLRFATAQQSLTLTALDFMYTQDRDNKITTYGWFWGSI